MLNTISKGELQNLRTSMRQEMECHLPVWKVLAKYISPRRIKYNDVRIDGSRKDQHIIRNQAGLSLRTFVSGMMNGATPRARPWFDLVTNDNRLNGQKKVQVYCDEWEAELNNSFQTSNLYRVLPLAYKDVGIFSNAAFAQLPHPRYGFYFYPYAIGTFAYSCDAEGNTNMFTRDTILTIRQIVENYAGLKATGHIDWTNVDDFIKKSWESARYLEEVKVTNTIVPNPVYNPTTARSALNPRASKFQSFTYVDSYIGSKSNTNNRPIGFRQEQGDRKEPVGDYLKISGYNYFPVITPRWEIEPEGVYGIDGPGHMAISDIITYQDMEKLRLEGASKLVRPPMVGHSSLRRHHSSILAGGITFLDDRGMSLGFKPAMTVDPKLGELISDQEEVKALIKSCFFEDLFLMLSSEEPISHRTTVEINERSSERLSALAPVLGQWDFDLSSKIISNGITILESQGRGPTRPKEMEGREVRAEYISTLAQAAKAALVQTQERFLNFLSSSSAALQDPAMLKIVNSEQYVREYAKNIGLNPDLLEDDINFDQIRQQITQMQSEDRRANMAAQEAKVAKDLSSAQINNGSLLDSYSQGGGQIV